jgi:hypothetical protein
MRRSIVLSLPLHFVFPGIGLSQILDLLQTNALAYFILTMTENVFNVTFFQASLEFASWLG